MPWTTVTWTRWFRLHRMPSRSILSVRWIQVSAFIDRFWLWQKFEIFQKIPAESFHQRSWKLVKTFLFWFMKLNFSVSNWKFQFVTFWSSAELYEFLKFWPKSGFFHIRTPDSRVTLTPSENKWLNLRKTFDLSIEKFVVCLQSL